MYHRATRKRAMSLYDIQTVADDIFEFAFENNQSVFDDIYDNNTDLVYEAIERYLSDMDYEFDDYDVTEIANFIAEGSSNW